MKIILNCICKDFVELQCFQEHRVSKLYMLSIQKSFNFLNSGFLQSDSDIERIKDSIVEKFKELLDSSQLIFRDDLFLNTRDLSPKARATLQKLIIELGETYPDYGEKMPKHWMDLQEKLFQLKQRGQRIISLSCLRDCNSELDNPLSDGELKVFLSFMHNAGYLLYFKGAGLEEMVVLDPKLIIDAMKCFITCRRFAVDVWGRKEWENMVTSGKMNESHIIEVWRKRNKSLFYDNREFLFRVMEKLDLITRPTIYDKGNHIIAGFYYVPSMVKAVAQEESQLINSAVGVSFRFIDVLQPAVVNKLICSCLSLWPVHNNKLFDGYVELESGLNHLLVIRRQFKEITLSFIHKTSPDDIDMNLCRSIKQYIRKSITRIVALYDNASSDDREELFNLEYNEFARSKHLDKVQ